LVSVVAFVVLAGVERGVAAVALVGEARVVGDGGCVAVAGIVA
jgi:hypothetical protein